LEIAQQFQYSLKTVVAALECKDMDWVEWKIPAWQFIMLVTTDNAGSD
jgi:hypothetical protein